MGTYKITRGRSYSQTLKTRVGATTVFGRLRLGVKKKYGTGTALNLLNLFLVKGIVSRDFGGLQMILMDRIGVPDVPLEVY